MRRMLLSTSILSMALGETPTIGLTNSLITLVVLVVSPTRAVLNLELLKSWQTPILGTASIDMGKLDTAQILSATVTVFHANMNRTPNHLIHDHDP